MMTPKELFLELLKKDGRPDRILRQYEALNMVMYDPINTYLRGNRVRGSVSRDRWGTVIDFPEDAPGAMPHVTDETKVVKDITRWREYAKAPDLSACVSGDWAACREKARDRDPRGEKLVTGFMGTGIFEQCHFLIPFTDVLTYLYEYPREMHELIDYILQYRLRYVKMLIDGLHPDAILSHDDWGAKDALFFRPEMWREFFKEPYREFYGYIRSRGVITIHHSDSYLVPILDDMAEIGIQVWQGALPENDIPAQLRRLRGSMVLMGGIGAAIDRQDASPEEIHSYVARTLETCCPQGHFIPSITYGVPGAVYPQVDPVIDETIDEYNLALHFPHTAAPRPTRRLRSVPRPASADGPADRNAPADAPASASAPTQPSLGPEDYLREIAGALQEGKKQKVTALTARALDAGVDPRSILSDGLVAGMTAVGEAFSSGRVFVPEMLMAARCMNAATEILKPRLTSGSPEDPGSRPTGTVCLGTVKGDLHDIGKNLVKIMMEGQGLRVVDLGTDVTAEAFVRAAVDHHADIIGCSALLTTSMDEMRKVVKQVRADRRLDNVKILVGGAPVTQEYCDEIGADCYTEDAAAAARAAAAMLSGEESA